MTHTSEKLIVEYERRLQNEFGEFISSGQIWRLLSYPTPDAFYKARKRGRVPFLEFELPGRRGRFFRTSEVAAWLSARIISNKEAI